MLPFVMQVNVQALQQRLPESQMVKRYAEIAQILTGDPRATAPEGTAWVQSLCKDLAIPPLRQYGLKEAHFEALIEKSARSNSMKGNPIPLTSEELHLILAQAI